MVVTASEVEALTANKAFLKIFVELNQSLASYFDVYGVISIKQAFADDMGNSKLMADIVKGLADTAIKNEFVHFAYKDDNLPEYQGLDSISVDDASCEDVAKFVTQTLAMERAAGITLLLAASPLPRTDNYKKVKSNPTAANVATYFEELATLNADEKND